MSWWVIALPDRMGHDWQGAYCDPLGERARCYILRSVEAGGNYTLFIVDLLTLGVTVHDLGLPVESTDKDYDPSMCGLTSDRTKLICCRARWSGLRCMEIDLQAKVARWLGEIAPAGDTSLNYPKWIRVRPDKWLMMAMTGDGAQWTFYEFRGEPEQLLDSPLWSRRATIPNNSGDGGTTCSDGSPYHMHQSVLFQDPYEPWKMWMGYHNRCSPSPNRFTYGLLYYDIIRDRFYGWKGDLLDEERVYRSYSEELRVDCPPPEDVTADRPDMGPATASGTRVKTNDYDFIILPHDVRDAEGRIVSAGLVKVDLRNKTTTPVYLPKAVGAPDIEHNKLWPLLPTPHGKVIGVQGYDPGAVVVYDPATNEIVDIGVMPPEMLRARTLGDGKRLWVLGDKALIPATHIVMTTRELIMWSELGDMRMLTKCIATGGAGSVRVDADFWVTNPTTLEVIIYRLPDFTAEVIDRITIPSKPFSKTYTGLTRGNKRVLCRAIP